MACVAYFRSEQLEFHGIPQWLQGMISRRSKVVIDFTVLRSEDFPEIVGSQVTTSIWIAWLTVSWLPRQESKE